MAIRADSQAKAHATAKAISPQTTGNAGPIRRPLVNETLVIRRAGRVASVLRFRAQPLRRRSERLDPYPATP